MKVASSSRIAVAACAVSLLLAACATNVSKLPPALSAPFSGDPLPLPEGSVISIRFPMLASEAAKIQLVAGYPCNYNKFIKNPFDSCGGPGFTGEFAPQLFEQSSYYSAELKRIYERYVDKSIVRLDPLLIDYKDGRFLASPVFHDATPGVVVVELYDFPESVAEHVGSGYRPRINIHTAGVLSPATCGNLLVADAHDKFDASLARDCVKLDARSVPGFMPIQFFAESAPSQVDFPKQSKSEIAPGMVLALSQLWEKNDLQYLQRSSQADFKVNPANIQNATSDWIARISLNGLRRIDVQQAFDVGFAHWAENYDPDLAARMRLQQLQGGDERKIVILRRLLAVENEWLNKQGDVLAEGILNGPYGASFRKTRLQMAEAYKKSQAMQWLKMGAVLASGFSSGLFAGGAQYNPSMLMSQTQLIDAQHSSAQGALEQALLQSISPGVEMRSQTLKVSIDGFQEEVHGSTQEEIQAQLGNIYKKLTKA